MLDRLLFLGKELHLKSVHNSFRNLVLNLEDVGEIAVVALSPDVVASKPVNQLRVDPDSATRLSDTAFEDVCDIELARDLGHMLRAALEAKGSVACDD